VTITIGAGGGRLGVWRCSVGQRYFTVACNSEIAAFWTIAYTPPALPGFNSFQGQGR